ncbi:MAG: glycosyl hydrolase family protein [Bacteroidetes bacterium]|nr:glycosyl hydrolase family protein [Bacteroidota bacterium]
MSGMFKILFIASWGLTSLSTANSCKKPSTSDPVEQPAPSNLVITANVSNDGSGKVDFVAQATNASTYSFEMGDGTLKDAADGKVQHSYTTVGTLSYTVKVTAKNTAGKSVTGSKDVVVTVAPRNLSLAWSDEFDKNGAPDPAKWGYDIGTGANGWGNNEVQYYTNRVENASVENGVLKIKAIRENLSGSPFTSARLLTKGKYEFKYGRVEVRAKVPAGVGTWPAIWMMGGDFGTVGWPACGEADIMEHRGSDLNRIVAALHYPGKSGGNAVVGRTLIQNATTEFHLYRFDWMASSLQFYVDGQLFHTVANSPSIPYNKDFFILLNLAMGGNFGGPVDPNLNSAIYEIDYVRVYR